ncbi:complement factor H isoform X4 [Gasterosteus aculeatus]
MGVKTQSCVLFLWMYTLTFVKSQECTLEQFVTGPMFDSNYDITNLAATYPAGEQVRVGCNVGYSGFFKLMCVQGNWESKGKACELRSCGHPGEADSADFHLEKGEDFVFGSQVVYTCQKGYQMVSRSNIRRCLAAGWDGVVPVCEARQCPPIDVDNNVQVVGNPEEAAYGNVLRFSCKSRDEKLSGSQELYCNENGAWSGKAPTCKGITCTVPNIQNGFVIGNVDQYEENEYLSFRCNPSYKAVDGRPSKCLKSGVRAIWSPTPLCKPIVCELPLGSQEGTQYEPVSTNVFSPGETVRVTCGNKYWIDNRLIKSAEITCKENGEWNLRPGCQEVTCSNQKPQHVDNWGVPWRGRITLDETARYSCVKDYKKPVGFNLATCTREGWTPNPLCQGKGRCSGSDVLNGIVAGPYNDVYYTACREGYKRFTKGWWATAECKNGKWSGLEDCIANTTCGKLPEILNGRVTQHPRQNKKVQITCNTGDGVLVKDLTCSEGEWLSNGLPPQTICASTAKSCNPPPKVENSIIKASYQREYFSDSEVTYQCRDNYMMEGQGKMICKDGQWMENIITCTPYCDKLRDESMTFTADKEIYLNEEFIRYRCDINNLEGIATCFNTKWNKTRECEVKPCELPDDTDNGYYQIIKGEDFVFGTTIQYFCNEGYQMVSREDTRTCLLDRWTNHVPICERMSCAPPALVEGVRVQGLPENDDPIIPGRFLTFSCENPGQDLNGSSRLACGEDGQWNKPFPSCEDTTCEVGPLQPRLGVTGLPAENEKIKNGHKLQFHCDNHFIIQGSREIECLPTGKWSDAFPTCTANQDCGEPPFLTNGDTTETSRTLYKRNERVHYSCKAYHTMEGEPYRTCINGKWSGEMKCLKPCTVDEEAMRSHNIRFRHKPDDKLYSVHLQWIGFTCTGGRNHVGTIGMRQMCVDGVMLLPTCQ